MPDKLTASNPIDRGGSGSIPESGSNCGYKKVEPIPRSPAVQPYRNIPYSVEIRFGFLGGKPRCPICLKNKPINRNGAEFCRKLGIAAVSGFHCLRCKVWWQDSNQALCFVCGVPFEIPEMKRHSWVADSNEGHRTCYHMNRIVCPFCPRCESVIGDDRNHSRRELRRRVGLRSQGSPVEGD